MKTHSSQNERIKHRYFTYLREARRASEPTVDKVAAALHRFERYTRFRDFKAFHIQQAMAFKRHLAEQINSQSGERLSKATLYSTLTALKNFFQWLAGQPGYRSRLSYADAEYFNLSDNETRIAKARREARVPTIDQILHVLRTVPAGTELERRNRALIAFTLLTGARDRAVASLKLKHVDFEQGCILQDAREVHTKFAKTFTTWFFPVGNEVRVIVDQWIAYLLTVKLWGPDDPLFPATRVGQNASLQFEAAGLDRKHWGDAGPIRRIFKEAFEAGELPYFNPHSFRKTLAQLGERVCRTPEEFKAWSQNLGHEHVMTTFSSYGQVPSARQAEIMGLLGKPVGSDDDAWQLVEKALMAARGGAFTP